MKKILLSVALVATTFISTAQIIVNGDFEAPVTVPIAGVGQTAGWGTGLFSAETTAPFAGTRSAKLETLNSPQLNQILGWGSDSIPGFITQTVNGPIINPANLTVTFSYKYTRVASDTGLVLVNLYDTLTADANDDVTLFQGFVELIASTNGWASMTLTLAANPQGTGTVNQFNVTAVSSNNSAISPGTTLWVDNFTTGYVGIEENEAINAVVYPNPASDVLNIKMNEEVASVVITALDGKVVATSTSTSISVSELNTGMYLYTINSVSGKVSKGNFVKN